MVSFITGWYNVNAGVFVDIRIQMVHSLQEDWSTYIKPTGNGRRKKTDKITAQAKKASQRELDEYANQLLKLPNAIRTNGKLSAKTINAYNKKMAELMS